MLLDADAQRLAEGTAGGLSGLMLHTDHGQRRLKATIAEIADAVRAVLPAGSSLAAAGGFTGVDGHSAQLANLIADAFAIAPQRVAIMSDIEVAFRGTFQPGEGYIVYAGTGSIAAYVDESGCFHRAGGRGVGLDDGGGGYWMAREALRHIWRREDEAPGAWKESALARAMFDRLGGSDWDRSRTFFYARERGDIGMLALAVRDTADADPVSREILRGAGIELARLAHAMIARYGTKPVALAGRAAKLHPIIEATLRERLPKVALRYVESVAHEAAARIALQRNSCDSL
jgi:N-acetylglucosamine kinase-like BadF-type ATPase